MDPSQTGAHNRLVEELDTVVIRFVGDSGDGMQLTGTEFTKALAVYGNDLSTLPDYPAEIRAPAGTIAGVSGFQIHFSSHEVFTPGDRPDVLVAMNPAALKSNLPDLVSGGLLFVNTGAFTPGNLEKAGYKSNPLDDNSLDGYRVFKVDITKLTALALTDSGLSLKEVARCKNFYALGIMFWLFNRDPEREIAHIVEKFAKHPEFATANIAVFRAGYNYGDTTEIFTNTYEVKPALEIAPGTYRNITGNEAVALGAVAASELSGVPLFLGSYPITPASEILHALSSYRNFNVTTFQAEDEIAGLGSAIGAAFSGVLGMTTTSGPGLALKSEMLGLAVITELPVVIVNVQRGGPSTGLPTKTEQSDLLQALYGRNGEAPIPVLAAASPAECFDLTVEAFRMAAKYMTPVLLLTDGYIGQGSEPWKLPTLDELKKIDVHFRTDPKGFQIYARDPATLAREWVRPGTPGLEHRIGGLEKDFLSGSVSYDPANHEAMCRVRAEKVARIEVPDQDVFGDPTGDILVVGWGGTFGSIREAVKRCRARGVDVSAAHLRYLNPLPKNLGDLLRRFKRILVPELNLGQLSKVLRATYLLDVVSYGKVQGKPFLSSDIVEAIEAFRDGKPIATIDWRSRLASPSREESEAQG